MQMVRVVDETRGTTVGERVEFANGSWTRMRGLLGREGLDAGGGLWIKPSSGVHTFFMKFAIDVVGLDKNLRVVKLWPVLVPWRVTSVSMKITSVVELAAGRIAECEIEVGDQFQITRDR